MQVEEQNVEEENIFPNDGQNNESDIQTKSSQQSMHCIVRE